MPEIKKNIAIISPLKPTYSETFIRAHIEQLPCNTFLYYSLPKRGYHPIYNPEDKALFSDFVGINYLETGIEKILGVNSGYFFRKKSLRKDLQKRKIDAVLCEYGPSGTMVMHDCALLNIPLIVHFHGRDAYHFKTIEKYSKKYREMFKIARGIIVVSTEMKSQLIELGCPESKISISPCGPNEDFNISVDIASNSFRFISTGRFVGKKAPFNTIRAFERASQKFPEAELIMLADGPLLNQSKRLVKELNIESRVKFLGPKPKAEILKLFRSSFCFVQHSVRADDGDSEGTPVSILEAMLAGIPVVSTRHAGIKDVIEESKSGHLVDEGDWVGMSDKMIKLMQNKTEARAIGLNAKSRVLKHFTLDHHLVKVWDTIVQSIG